MQIIQTAEFTVVDSSSRASLTIRVFPRQAVPYGAALADLPRRSSGIIDALEMRHLASVPTTDALTLALAAVLFEVNADWARDRFSQLSNVGEHDVAGTDAQLLAFARYVSHEYLLPMWEPLAAPRSLASFLEMPSPEYHTAIAGLVAAGATPLVLIAAPEGIILCGEAEGVAAADAERRFQVLRVWRTRGAIESPALRRYIGLEVPWSDDTLYYFVVQWARLHGLDPRHLPNDDDIRRELQQHLITVEANQKEQERLMQERPGPSHSEP